MTPSMSGDTEIEPQPSVDQTVVEGAAAPHDGLPPHAATVPVKDQNEEHLRMLSIFHYVVAAFASLFALFPLIHLVIGVAILTGKMPSSSGDDEMRWLGAFFVAFAAAWILMGLSFAVCLFLAGRNLAKRTRYTFCLVMAGLECMFVPFGTVLGVFTIVVLMKEPVKALFGAGSKPAEN